MCHCNLYPRLKESSSDPSTVVHGLKTVIQTTKAIKKGPTPIVCMDCTLFAIAKKIQWMLHSLFGQNKSVYIFARLHLVKQAMVLVFDLIRLDDGIWLKLAWLQPVSLILWTKIPYQTASKAEIVMTTSIISMFWEKDEEIFMKVLKQIRDLIICLVFNMLDLVKASRILDRGVMYFDTVKRIVIELFSIDYFHYARWILVDLQDIEALQTSNSELLR